MDHGLTAVSYTHLDVYKRQLHNLAISVLEQLEFYKYENSNPDEEFLRNFLETFIVLM